MHSQSDSGFTLIEMLVTISIMGILLAIALPSYQSVTTGIRMDSEINGLIADINFARSEAIKVGQNVNICPATGSNTAGFVCSASSPLNWSAGWDVLNLNAVAVLQQLRIGSGVTHGDTLNGGVAPIVFTPAGYTGFANTITLHDANNDASQRRCIVFATGSWSTKTGSICP